MDQLLRLEKLKTRYSRYIYIYIRARLSAFSTEMAIIIYYFLSFIKHICYTLGITTVCLAIHVKLHTTYVVSSRVLLLKISREGMYAM